MKAGKPFRVDETVVDKAFDQAFMSSCQEWNPVVQSGVDKTLPSGRGELYTKGVEASILWTSIEMLNGQDGGRGSRRRCENMLGNSARNGTGVFANSKAVDYPDVIRIAHDLAQKQPEPMYRAAIVDESQDLTLVGLKLIRSLVSSADGQDRPGCTFHRG